MKISQGMKLIGEKWVVKPKQFRVQYQKMVNSELVTEYTPGLEEPGLDSDVTAWRYAWKLHVSTKTESREIQAEELINIRVVDELNTPVIYYVTGKKKYLIQNSGCAARTRFSISVRVNDIGAGA